MVRTLTLLDGGGDTTFPGKLTIAPINTGDYGGAIEIRELNKGGVLTGVWNEGPRINLHWLNRTLMSFGLLADGNFHRNGNKIWDAGNDGAGSGLDADLLDGFQSNDFFRNNRATIQPTDIDTFAERFSGTYSVIDGGSTKTLTVFKNLGSTSAVEIESHFNNTHRIRVAVDNNRYSGWLNLLTSGNYQNYTYPKADADSRFVNVTGDTMTGALNVNAYITSTTGWFQNNTINTGLYNSNQNARWYATTGPSEYLVTSQWIADKSIRSQYFVAGRTFVSNSSRTITITGDKDAFYPVHIRPINSWNNLPMRICISKALGSTSNLGWEGNHSNGTSSLTFCWEGRENGWDGNNNYTNFIVLSQPYAKLVGNCAKSDGPRIGWVVWLRGGTATYEIYSTYEMYINVYYSRTDVGQSGYPRYIEPLALSGIYSNDINRFEFSTNPIYSYNAYFRGISLIGHNEGVINFRYKDSDSEYTSRIVEAALGRIAILGKLAVGATGVNDSYALSATSFYSSGNLTVNGVSTFSGTVNTNAINASTITCSNWLRTTGDTGWFSEKHRGGIHMTDETWVRVYNNKAFFASDKIKSNTYFDRGSYGGSSWNNGPGAYNVEILNNSAQTPIIVAYRSGYTPLVTGANRLFSFELLNTGSHIYWGFGGYKKFEFRNTGDFFTEGSIVSKGEVTAYTTSDMRLKKNIQQMSVEYSKSVLKSIRPVTYEWNGKAFELNPHQRYKGRETGLIAQELQPILPCAIKTVFGEYMSIDYTRLIPPIIAVVNEHEQEIERLKKRIKELESKFC